MSSMDNWRLSQNLRWLGRNNTIPNSHHYRGVVFEIEYND